MSEEQTQEAPKKKVRQMEMVKVQASGLVIDNLADAWQLSNAIHRSQLAPHGLDSPEKILIAMQTGMEAGLKPMISLRSVVVINGFPSWKSEAALALVRRSGMLDKYRSEEIRDNGECVGWRITTKRKDDANEVQTEFTKKDAKRAGLLDKRESMYLKYPQRMYYSRALGFNLRDQFPDVLMGLTVEEEVMDYERGKPAPKNAEGSVVAEPVLAPPQEDPLLTGLDDAAGGESQSAPEPDPDPEVEPAPAPIPDPQQEVVVEDEAQETEIVEPESNGLDDQAAANLERINAEKMTEWMERFMQDPVYLDMVRNWDVTKALEPTFRKRFPGVETKGLFTGQMAAAILVDKGYEPHEPDEKEKRVKKDEKMEKVKFGEKPQKKRGRPKKDSKNNDAKASGDKPAEKPKAPSQEDWEKMTELQRVEHLASDLESINDVKVLRARAYEAIKQLPPDDLPLCLANLMMESKDEIEQIGKLHLRRVVLEVLDSLTERGAK